MSRVIKPIGSQAGRVAKTTFFNKAVSDFGNYPIIGTNIVAATMITIFGLRKLVYHPDISISEELRANGKVQNETASRLDNSTTFRHQTQSFASFLKPMTAQVMHFATGYDVSDKWKTDFIIKESVDTPLEQTDYFHDGLYATNKPALDVLPNNANAL